ncbi:MAG TPA: AAA family ATPase [Gaiellaceae bacterium]|jgi:DNA repair protein RecN (Recombination protein N)|nr:AAA family ATPase [Gaiellaceae bacterium]
MLRRLHIESFVLIREADLVLAPGLNAVTGETGAGKTILAQAVGLLLGAPGDAAYLGPGAEEAYVEAELDLSEGILDEPGLEALAELRPADEEGLVAARRVFADGRTRAYAWGRAVPREDLATLVERLLAMSGQFEQRRLARASHQLEVLDAFVGEAQLRRRAELGRAWRELVAARRARDELAHDEEGRAARVEELRELVARTEGIEPGAEERLLSERERLRHVTELAEAATVAAEELAPEQSEGSGASGSIAEASRHLEGVSGLAPELAEVGGDLGEAEIRVREAASTLRAFLASLEAEPGRLEIVEGELDRIAEARRRFGASTTEDLVARASSARAELDRLEEGGDPLAAAEQAVAEAEARVGELATALSAERTAAAPLFAEAVAGELQGLGMGEGEFRVDLTPGEPGPTGSESAVFLVRPNAGLPFAPAAETASGGELSRIALALRAVAHAAAGEPTIVFDEIDAGIGGQTAHAVADALARLAGRAQLLTITHLPQIASVAEAHFRVEKVPGDPTHTRIERLSEAERQVELERMLGGAEFLSTVRRVP